MRNRIALALLLCLTAPAFAHVTLVEPSAKPGSDYLAQFRVGHGCGESPTIALKLEIPAGVTALAPQAKPGWTIEKTATSITWRGGRIDPHTADTFIVRMKLPQTPDRIFFPAMQSCESGVEQWSEIPAADGAPLKYPAPVLTLAAAGATPEAADGLSVKDGWMRALPAGLPAGGYFTLRNDGKKDRVLTGAASPACSMLMLHKSDDKGGMTSMNDVAEIALPAGGTISFAPGGYHLMCMDAKLTPGATVPVTLRFRDGASVQSVFAVRNAAGK